MDNGNEIQKYIIELYGNEYQNNGIFNNIDKSLIEKWRDKDKKVIIQMENTINNIKKYLDISDRKILALNCGAFLIDDGYDNNTDKIWNGKGVKAITINDYNNLNTEEKQKTIPVCPGDELQYFGAFGLNWATHNGIYMGTDNINKFGKIIEVDSHIQPTKKNRVYSLTLMMALGYICGSINCYRELDGFTHHYIGNDAIENGPCRPTSIVENINRYSRKKILERSIKALKIKIWEYNIQTANCETFTKFIVSGEWFEDNFFYVRILENLIEAYLKDYKDSNEITEIYKLLIIIFNKTPQNDIQDKIFKLLKNINKKIVENENVEFKEFFYSLDKIGLDLINNKNQIKKYKNVDISFDNSTGRKRRATAAPVCYTEKAVLSGSEFEESEEEDPVEEEDEEEVVMAPEEESEEASEEEVPPFGPPPVITAPDNSNGKIKVNEDSRDFTIQNAIVINKKDKYKENESSYKEIINNQDILINELKKINKKIDKNRIQLLEIINKLIDKIN